jgi:hypothetical protein
VERGVYAFVPGGLDAATTPSSLLAPLLGTLVERSSLVVETSAPPVLLLAGVPADGDLPAGARRVDDVVVIGRATDVAVVEERLRSGARPRDAHEALAASTAPVAWAGPLPRLHREAHRGLGEGRLLLETTGDRVTLSVRGSIPSAAAAQLVEARLAEGSPPGSPGKPWRDLLPEAEVRRADGAVIVEASADGLDGPLLRSLLDGQALSFLSS